MDELALCFPLLGILFAFIVGTRFAMSNAEEWSAGGLLSAHVLGGNGQRVCASRLLSMASVVVLIGTIRRPKKI